MRGLGLLVATLAWGGAAHAADVYVNGVRADGLADVELKGVDVRVAPNGDIWIDAPTYRVELEGEPSSAQPAAASAKVPAGRYWLVTEDNASKGLVLDVIVNGQAVAKLKSGQPQTILDIGPWLRHGTNTVVVNALQGRGASGGIFYVYMGEGSADSGTLMMDRPEITFARRAEDPSDDDGGRTSRSFQLKVP